MKNARCFHHPPFLHHILHGELVENKHWFDFIFCFVLSIFINYAFVKKASEGDVAHNTQGNTMGVCCVICVVLVPQHCALGNERVVHSEERPRMLCCRPHIAPWFPFLPSPAHSTCVGNRAEHLSHSKLKSFSNGQGAWDSSWLCWRLYYLRESCRGPGLPRISRLGGKVQFISKYLSYSIYASFTLQEQAFLGKLLPRFWQVLSLE